MRHTTDVSDVETGVPDILRRLLTPPERSGVPPVDVILEGVADGITVQQATGEVIYANAAAARLIGCPSPQALVQTPPAEIMQRFVILDEARQPFPLDRLPGRRVLSGEQDASATLCFRVLATGEERWSVVKATPVLDAGGKARFAVSVFVDITERKRAEETQHFLAEASKRLAGSLEFERTLQQVADLAVPALADWCSVDILGDDGAIRTPAVAHVDPRKVAWAKQLQARYPMDPNAPRGVPNVLRTGQAERLPEITDDLLVATARDPEQLQLLRDVGFTSAMIVPLRARGRTLGALSLVWTESGRRFGPTEQAVAEQLAGAAALAIDNARLFRAEQQARREAERALTAIGAERDRLQQILDVLPAGIIIVDAGGKFVLGNAAVVDILGLDITKRPMPQAGLSAYEHFGARRLNGMPYPAEALPIHRSLLQGEIVRGEQLLIRRAGDGRELPILVNSAPLRDGRQAIVGAVCALQDISPLKEIDRQKDEFLAAVSHDLKNPLMAIRGQAQVLQRRARRADSPEMTRVGESMAEILASTDRITAMVDELLDLTRMQMARPLDLDRQTVNLVPLAGRLAEECRRATGRTVRLHAGVPELIGQWDPARLERVLDNLLNNAVKYSPSGGEITVTLDVAGAEAVLSITDQGFGVPAADLPHIFERFHRGSNVRGRVAGTGIGLSGVQHIVEQHGGRITVQSREGEGSTFTIHLPLSSTATLDAQQ